MVLPERSGFLKLPRRRFFLQEKLRSQSAQRHQHDRGNHQPFRARAIDFIGRSGCNQFRRLAAVRAGDGFANCRSGKFKVAGAATAFALYKNVVGHCLKNDPLCETKICAQRHIN